MPLLVARVSCVSLYAGGRVRWPPRSRSANAPMRAYEEEECERRRSKRFGCDGVFDGHDGGVMTRSFEG